MSYTEDDVYKIIEHLKDYPEDVEEWHHLGVIFLSLNNTNDAENAFRHCIKIDSNYGLAHGDLGSLLILKGKTKEAIKHLLISVKILPKNHEYWSALGVAYLRQSKYKDAVKAFNASLLIKPDYYDAIVSLGMTLLRREDWKEAAEILHKADKLNADNYEVLKGLAKALMKLQKTDELEKIYLRMYELNPEEYSLLLYLGQIAFNKGRLKEGIEKIEQALHLDPKSVMGWSLYADILESCGRNEESRQAREKHKILLDEQKKLQRLWGG